MTARYFMLGLSLVHNIGVSMTSKLIAAGAMLLLAMPAQAAQFAAYRALYTLEPARIDQSSTAVPLDGRVAYEVTGSECAGWSVDMRFATRFADGEKGSKIIDSRSHTFETADGLSMEANQQQYVNDSLADDQHISVHRATLGAEADAQQTGSKDAKFKVGPDMIFPSQHQAKLLAEAAAGQTRDVSMVYDASDGDKQFRIVTFIGKKREAGQTKADADKDFLAPLKKLANWPFQLGYYPTGDGQADSPEFQATFNMYENGITTEMVFDYGSYALKGTIASLELLPQDPCPGQAAQPDATKQQ